LQKSNTGRYLIRDLGSKEIPPDNISKVLGGDKTLATGLTI
jgi:hypothetical protein